MLMFLEILNIVYKSIGNAVVWVVSLFAKFGLNWLHVIAGGAVLALLLRLFVRAFIGDRLYGAATDAAVSAYAKAKHWNGKTVKGNTPYSKGKFAKTKSVSGHRAGH